MYEWLIAAGSGALLNLNIGLKKKPKPNDEQTAYEQSHTANIGSYVERPSLINSTLTASSSSTRLRETAPMTADPHNQNLMRGAPNPLTAVAVRESRLGATSNISSLPDLQQQSATAGSPLTAILDENAADKNSTSSQDTIPDELVASARLALSMNMVAAQSEPALNEPAQEPQLPTTDAAEPAQTPELSRFLSKGLGYSYLN